MRCQTLRAIVAMFALAGCAPVSAGSGDALMDADRAFARETAERGAEGWAAWFAEDGVMFPPTGRENGREAIRTRMVPVFGDTNGRLTWDPTEAVLASSGDLGYTIGRWESSRRDSSGTWAGTGTGNYVTIWRRQADGTWKVAVDIGNQDPQPATDSIR